MNSTADARQSDDYVTISFPDLAPAEAAQLAKSLEQEFLKAGIPREHINLIRQDPDNMDGGATVLLAHVALWLFAKFEEAASEFVKGMASKAGSKTLDWLLQETGVRARISRPDGSSIMVGERYARPVESLGAAPEDDDDGEDSTPDKQTASASVLGVVLLGASTYPRMPASLDLDKPEFAKSAALARSMFSPAYTSHSEVLMLDLFDEELTPGDVIDCIDDLASRNPDMRELLIYYCGHGDFIATGEYYLLLKETEKGNEHFTGLMINQLRYAFEQRPPLLKLRCHLVLDCCFAGAAIRAFSGSSDTPACQSSVDGFPDRGWALLTASGSKQAATCRGTGGATMFTSALADAMGGKVPGATGQLSLARLHEHLARHLYIEYGNRAVMPQVFPANPAGASLSQQPLFVSGPEVVPCYSTDLIEDMLIAAQETLESDEREGAQA